MVDHVSKTGPPPSAAIGTFNTIAVTLRFFVKSGVGGQKHRDRAPGARHYIGL